MNRLMTFGGALLCVLMMGCSLPPFNEDLSLATATAARLEPVVRIGPIQAWHGDFEGSEIFFMPFKDSPGSKQGFLVIASDYYLRIRFLDGLTGQFNGDARFDGPAADPNQKTYAAESLKGGAYLSLAVFDPANSDNNSLFLIDPTFAAPGSSSVNLYSALNGDFLSASLDRIVGAHIYPETDPLRDSFAFFGVLNTSGHFGETGRYTQPLPAGSGGIGPATVPPLNRPDVYLASLPSLGSGAFYYHRPVAPNTSYLSWYDSSTGTYKNYAWDDGLAVRELTGMHRRIDALLTSGELLSFTYGVCSVYDGNGTRKYGFPMGSLHFCFEKYDIAAGTYRLYFSLAYWIYGYHDSNDNLYINVYSIPTASLESLD
jgi:hypothetical protein